MLHFCYSLLFCWDQRSNVCFNVVVYVQKLNTIYNSISVVLNNSIIKIAQQLRSTFVFLIFERSFKVLDLIGLKNNVRRRSSYYVLELTLSGSGGVKSSNVNSSASGTSRTDALKVDEMNGEGAVLKRRMFVLLLAIKH